MATRRRRKRRSSASNSLIVVLVILAAVVLVCVIASRPSAKKDGSLGSNIQIEGVDISKKTKEEALELLAAQEEEIAAAYGVTFVYGDYSRTATAEELGITFNTESLLEQAQKGDRLEITPSFDTAAIRTLIGELHDDVDIPVQEPTVDGFDFDTLAFSYTNGHDGLTLDDGTLEEDILSLLKTDKKGTILLTATPVSRENDPDDLSGHFGEMSSFSTYCTNNENSEHNMRLAMQYMDHAVIPAGGVFSFNETTGDSTTPEGGWVPSGAWVHGRLQDQYGGGLCQAATTFYISALYAGMDVVERYEHMQPSSYCREGLDATIDYPGMDLKMLNTTEHPIYVSAVMDGLTLTVTLYGYLSDEYDYIELSGWYTDTIPMPEAEYETDDSMEDGAFELISRGYGGSRAQAERRWIGFDGSVLRTDALPSSSYSAVAPLYKIGPNTDTAAIPEGEDSGVVSSEPEESEDPEGSENSENPESSEGSEASENTEPPETSQEETSEGPVDTHEDPELIRG